MIGRIAILGCGAKKASARRLARELYTGPLFRAARDYIEAAGLPYAILSARWGLVAPWASLEPYDLTVKEQRRHMGDEDWRIWCHAQGSALLHQLELGIFGRLCGWPAAFRLEVHAGAEYAAWVRELRRKARALRVAVVIGKVARALRSR